MQRNWLALVVATFGLLTSMQAAARTADRVYVGSIGERHVVMRLPAKPGATFGASTYYRDKPMDIVLQGRLAGETLVLVRGQTGERFRLVRQADGDLHGSWRDSTGVALPVRLHVASMPAPRSGEPAFVDELRRDGNVYGVLRYTGLELVRDKRQQFMGYTLQWWREAGSGSELFTVAKGYPADQRKRLNKALKATLWKWVRRFYASCIVTQRSGEWGGYRHRRVMPTFMNSSALSVRVLTDGECAGGPPFADLRAINLDVRTGRHLQLNDVFWVGEGEPYRRDDAVFRDSAWHKRDEHYRREVLAPWLVRTFKRLYPQHMRRFGDACNYTRASDWGRVEWYLTPRGIFFIPMGGFRPCQFNIGWSILPYAIVDRQPGSLDLTLP